jgi:hypothetical protein
MTSHSWFPALALGVACLGSCNTVAPSPCQELTDSIAVQSSALSLAAGAPTVRERLTQASATLAALELRDEHLDRVRTKYLEGLNSAESLLGQSENNRTALEKVNGTTFETLYDLNLYCSSHR